MAEMLYVHDNSELNIAHNNLYILYQYITYIAHHAVPRSGKFLILLFILQISKEVTYSDVFLE